MRLLRVVLVIAAWLSPLIAPANAVAQTSTQLRVHIVDTSHKPIGAARVTLYVQGRTDAVHGATSIDGTCAFVDLDAGNYLVDADSDGFAAGSATHVMLERGVTRDITIVLAAGRFETHVVVTASDGAEPREDVAKAFSVVDREELAARDVFTLGDAVRAMSGVRVEQLGGPGSQTGIRLRGLRSQDTTVLLDGVPFRDASATQGDASSFISDLLLTNVDRVEVVRGSGADVYGTNAIAGAVNLVTRGGGHPTSGEALVEGGGLGLVRSASRIGGGTNDHRWMGTIGASGLNVADGVDGHDRAWNTTIDGRVTGRLRGVSFSGLFSVARAFTALNASPASVGAAATNPAQAVALSMNQLALYESGTPVGSLNVGGATFIPSANDPDSTRRSTSSVALLQLADLLTNRLDYSVSYHRVSTTRRFENGPQGIGFQPAGTTQSTFDGEIDTIHVKSDIRLSEGQTITAAYQVERERYTNASSPAGAAQPSAAAITEWSHTASVQDRWSLVHGAVQLAGGVRVQAFALRTPEFSPAASAPYQGVNFEAPPNAYTGDASAAYHVAQGGPTVRVHLGTGYRAPSLFERFGTSFGSRGYSVYGDPRLAPERSVGLDAGIDQDLHLVRARVSASVFTTQLKQVIVFDSSGIINPATDPFKRASGYRTVDGGRASGVEVSARAAPAPWLMLTGAYTFSTESSSEPNDQSLSFGLPRHQGSIQAVARLGPRIETSALFASASSYVAPLSDVVTFVSRNYRFDGVRRLDLSASYRIPLGSRRNVRVFTRVDNVANQTYYESGFRTPGRVAAAGVAAGF